MTVPTIYSLALAGFHWTTLILPVFNVHFHFSLSERATSPSRRSDKKRIAFSLQRSDAALLVTTKTRRIDNAMRIRIFVATACFEGAPEKIETKQTLKTTPMHVPTIYSPAPAGFHWTAPILPAFNVHFCFSLSERAASPSRRLDTKNASCFLHDAVTWLCWWQLKREESAMQWESGFLSPPFASNRRLIKSKSNRP
jgi:hypothetical protein